MSEPRERLRDAIAGERRDWHVVEVRPDDLAAVLDSPPDGWAWQCAGCHRPVPPMGMCETCGVFGIMRTAEPAHTLDLDSPESEDSLDAAWAEAEAAMPEGCHLDRLRRTADGWVASVRGEFDATQPGRRRHHHPRVATGPTPTAALRALAARLSEGSGS